VCAALRISLDSSVKEQRRRSSVSQGSVIVLRFSSLGEVTAGTSALGLGSFVWILRQRGRVTRQLSCSFQRKSASERRLFKSASPSFSRLA